MNTAALFLLPFASFPLSVHILFSYPSGRFIIPFPFSFSYSPYFSPSLLWLVMIYKAGELLPAASTSVWSKASTGNYSAGRIDSAAVTMLRFKSKWPVTMAAPASLPLTHWSLFLLCTLACCWLLRWFLFHLPPFCLPTPFSPFPISLSLSRMHTYTHSLSPCSKGHVASDFILFLTLLPVFYLSALLFCS